jgi:uncharacterized repeat protein (TIGR03803 family)
MRPKELRFALIRGLVVFTVALLVAPGIWAKPKFSVLARIPGGLRTGLTLDSKGNLYGVTGGGGTNGVGSVFEVSRNSKGRWIVTTLHSFDGTDGSSPNGNLIFDAAGNLYGTAINGGLYDRGTVFELTPGSGGGWSFGVIYNFCPQYNCLDGAEPDGGVTLGRDGSLYGTAGGGPDCCGVAYELTPGSGGWNESVLYDFGSKPYDATASTAPLIFGKAGDLYGTSSFGGKYHSGTVFKLAHHSDGWSERVLYSFCREGGYLCKDGAAPEGGLAFDAEGNLYGTTDGGGPYRAGVVFKLTPTDRNWKEVILYGFGDVEKGVAPASGIVRGNGGILYGTTALGGSGGCNYGCGVVYKLAPKAHGKWAYTVLHKFDGTDGGLPDGGVTRDERGSLYGTAYSTVYEVAP